MGVVCATGHTTHALTSEGADAREDVSGRGTPIVAAHWPDTMGPLMARDAKGPRNYMNGSLQASAVVHGRPRRLTPRECERLMGWPDDFTRYGADEAGVIREHKDTPRYRMIGNGVGSPVAAWIGARLRDALAARARRWRCGASSGVGDATTPTSR
jgi:DNA (cytosine-5)-methyltransferase 1